MFIHEMVKMDLLNGDCSCMRHCNLFPYVENVDNQNEKHSIIHSVSKTSLPS